jgi:hypothetical protein
MTLDLLSHVGGGMVGDQCINKCHVMSPPAYMVGVTVGDQMLVEFPVGGRYDRPPAFSSL